MSIQFYLHTPLSEEMHERRSLLALARELQQRVGHLSEAYTLIANIDIAGLPQLDALLLAPRFVAICECKAYFDPIVGRHLTGKWYAERGKRRQLVRGGSQRNPFLQVKRSRLAWQADIGQQMSAFLLFYPYLHPDSKLPRLGPEEKWLSIQGMDEIGPLLHSTRSADPHLILNADAQLELAEKIGAVPWPILPQLVRTLGFLNVIETGRPLVRYPIRPFESMTIGRSTRVGHMVQLRSAAISSTHARLYTEGNDLYLEDLGSKNGTYLGQTKLVEPCKLNPSTEIRLGSAGPDAPRLRFVPTTPQSTLDPTKPTF